MIWKATNFPDSKFLIEIKKRAIFSHTAIQFSASFVDASFFMCDCSLICCLNRVKSIILLHSYRLLAPKNRSCCEFGFYSTKNVPSIFAIETINPTIRLARRTYILYTHIHNRIGISNMLIHSTKCNYTFISETVFLSIWRELLNVLSLGRFVVFVL